MSKYLLLATVVVAIISVSPAFAASDRDLEGLRAEIQEMREAYENKIERLEQKVEQLEAQQNQTTETCFPLYPRTAVPKKSKF